MPWQLPPPHQPSPGRAGAGWGLLWGFPFGLLFFIPVLGMAAGAGLGTLIGKAVEAMSKNGGTVLKTSLSRQDERELQEALHGGQAAAR